MTAKDAIKQALNGSHTVLTMYLSDLADADLLVRPTPGANHAAWQLGHLISAETRFLKEMVGGRPPELPAGFAEQHGKEKAAGDPPRGFGTKKEYLDLYGKVRAATVQALANLPEADLDKPTSGPMARLAPTVGDAFLLMANHEMMHGGQLAVLRRKLGKPILI